MKAQRPNGSEMRTPGAVSDEPWLHRQGASRRIRQPHAQAARRRVSYPECRRSFGRRHLFPADLSSNVSSCMSARSRKMLFLFSRRMTARQHHSPLLLHPFESRDPCCLLRLHPLQLTLVAARPPDDCGEGFVCLMTVEMIHHFDLWASSRQPSSLTRHLSRPSRSRTRLRPDTNDLSMPGTLRGEACASVHPGKSASRRLKPFPATRLHASGGSQGLQPCQATEAEIDARASTPPNRNGRAHTMRPETWGSSQEPKNVGDEHNCGDRLRCYTPPVGDVGHKQTHHIVPHNIRHCFDLFVGEG